jgi:hypothetical protein
LLRGAAEAMPECVCAPIPWVERAEYDRGVVDVRARLGDAVIATAWAERQAMVLEQAIAYASQNVDAS